MVYPDDSASGVVLFVNKFLEAFVLCQGFRIAGFPNIFMDRVIQLAYEWSAVIKVSKVSQFSV
jgi:hypothetical protein